MGGIGCLVLLILILLKYRRKRHRLAQEHLSKASSEAEAQPYLQQKAELEDLGSRRFELDGNHRAYEMQAPGTVQEISAGRTVEGLPSLNLWHELVGEELVKELGGHCIM